MANHKSAEKRNRQRLIRTVRNRAVKTRVRRVLKEARLAVADATEEAAGLVKSASIMLDQAASKNVLPAKRVARVKSRLARALNRMGTAPAEPAKK